VARTGRTVLIPLRGFGTLPATRPEIVDAPAAGATAHIARRASPAASILLRARIEGRPYPHSHDLSEVSR
jgi:hypothetical protein